MATPNFAKVLPTYAEATAKPVCGDTFTNDAFVVNILHEAATLSKLQC